MRKIKLTHSIMFHDRIVQTFHRESEWRRKERALSRNDTEIDRGRSLTRRPHDTYPASPYSEL